jgi:hypothetical protein
MLFENLFMDPQTDKIGKLIAKFQSYAAWTAEKRAARDKFVTALTNANYDEFTGHRKDYHFSGIGSGYIYQVPSNKRGHLKIYRDQLIRIVCVGQSRFEVFYMAGAVNFNVAKLISFKDYLDQRLNKEV